MLNAEVGITTSFAVHYIRKVYAQIARRHDIRVLSDEWANVLKDVANPDIGMERQLGPLECEDGSVGASATA